jgi:hypothetical protein
VAHPPPAPPGDSAPNTPPAAVALTLAQPFTLKRILYISTENPAVPGEAEVHLLNQGFSVVSYKIRRSNTGPLTQVVDLGADNAGQPKACMPQGMRDGDPLRIWRGE